MLGKPAHLQGARPAGGRPDNLKVTAATGVVRGVDVKLLQPARWTSRKVLRCPGCARVSRTHTCRRPVSCAAAAVQRRTEDATPGSIDAVLPGYLLPETARQPAAAGHPGASAGQLQVTGTDLRAAGRCGQPAAGAVVSDRRIWPPRARGSRCAPRPGDVHPYERARGRFPGAVRSRCTASGNIDLARLNPLLESGGRRISGTIDVNAQVAGTLDAPTVKGTVPVAQGCGP